MFNSALIHHIITRGHAVAQLIAALRYKQGDFSIFR